LVKDYVTGEQVKDSDGMPYTIIGFGNGENRVNGNRSSVAALDEMTTNNKTYHQEAVVQTAAGSETHGGTDVFLGAIGKGAESFKGTMENIQVYSLIKSTFGL
jgi:alkaline phosphatase